MDARDSKFDKGTRVVRGMTLASIEFVRLFADAISTFGSEALRRNESREGEGRTVRDLTTRLPEDVAHGVVEAIDRFSDIPAKAAERYTTAYREGERTRFRDEGERARYREEGEKTRARRR